MNRQIIDKLLIKREWVDLADKVVLARPSANRKHDQIYMMSGAMIVQTILMHDYVEGKEIIFVGDGDGMSMMFGLFGKAGVIPCPRSMKVLDMDKEDFKQIIKRKYNEEMSTGQIFWGYSGTLLKPSPTALYLKSKWENGEKPHLFLVETKSLFKNGPHKSLYYSIDKNIWHSLPTGINVYGSDKAIICRGFSTIFPPP